MMNPSALIAPGALFWGCVLATNQAVAIESSPTPDQIQAAIQRGKAAAEQRRSPDQLYTSFGSTDDLTPRGFLMTKLGGILVMTSHLALRSLAPSEQDVAQVLENKNLLVNVVIFGDQPNFARDSYVVLEQGGQTVKPVNVRFDARAERSSVWPRTPAYRAKVVALFAYADFDPRAKTKLSVFPSSGGEVSFDLDFAAIE
ncbi:MAG: hypothetical protein ABW047_14900 [Nitrospiraceae bacterium]